jgi:RHS repeat-associated protein
MQMPGREFSAEEYRYGFNGMEKDDEFKGEGNSYDYGARMYDSRIGRWLSVDPLAGKFQDISPFSFAANNPIYFIDPDGRTIKGFNEDDIAKVGIIVQDIFSDYQVIQKYFQTNRETMTFERIENMDAFHADLMKIEDSDARAAAYSLAKAISSDLTYEVAFVKDDQDISQMSYGAYSTGSDLDGDNGGASRKITTNKYRLIINEASIQRTNIDGMILRPREELLLTKAQKMSVLSIESAVFSGIVMGMYEMNDPFIAERIGGKVLSPLQTDLTIVQLQNTAQVLIGESELHAEDRYGKTTDKELMKDRGTPHEIKPQFMMSPLTLSPMKESEIIYQKESEQEDSE